MIKMFLFFIFLLSLSVAANELKTGDVLVQPLDCYLCNLIEAEEESIYSHIGVVFVKNKEIKVFESFGRVKEVDLKTFLAKTQKNQKVLWLRPNENINPDNDTDNDQFYRTYLQDFDQKSYDAEFSWDNDSYYCSELVAKLLNEFLTVKIPTKKMHFDRNRMLWENHFHGNIPDGEEGIAPSDFLRSGLFKKISEI